MMIFNHTRFHRNFTKMIPVKSSKIDKKNETNITIPSDEIKAVTEHFPLNLEVHDQHHAHDQGNSFLILIYLAFFFVCIFYFRIV